MTNKIRLMDFLNRPKPIVGMIHLKGETPDKVFNRAIREIHIMVENDIDAIMVENYFGTSNDVIRVLEYLKIYRVQCRGRKNFIYGLNILGDYKNAYYIADSYGASFVQIDSVAGHLNGVYDMVFEKELNFLRDTSDTFLMGGVRFKYQPYVSGRTLEQDLQIGMERCDAIVVTGDATGVATDLNKIKKFREIIGTFPIVVGAGLTTSNCEERLMIADAGIVGSYIKDTHQDNGEVSEIYTKEFMDKVKTLRMNK